MKSIIKRGEQLLTEKQLTFKDTVNGEILNIDGLDLVVTHVIILNDEMFYLNLNEALELAKKNGYKSDQLRLLNIDAPDEAFPDVLFGENRHFYKRKFLRHLGVNIRTKSTWVTMEDIVKQGKVKQFFESLASLDKSAKVENNAA